MKFTCTLIALLFCFSSLALDFEASSPSKGEFVARASGVVQASPQRVLDILEDIENACEEGCRYYAPSIKKSVAIKRVENIQYNWTFVDEFMDSKYFSKSIREEFALRFMTPTKEEIKELVTTNFKHEPLFYTRTGVWTVTETENGTYVTFDLSMKTNKGVVSRFKKKVIKGLKKSVIANFRNFEK